MKEDKSKLQLIGEIAEANNKNLELIEEINKLSNKIDKAIEYIKERQYQNWYQEGCFFEELLEILGDKENE